MSRIHTCEAILAWLKMLLYFISGKVETEVKSMTSTRSLLDEVPLQGPVKKMRIDTDLVDEVNRAVADGKAHTCQALMRSRDSTLPDRTVHDMAGKFLSAYLQAGILTFSSRGDVCVTLDGTRVGNPAEDTLPIILRSCRHELECIPAIKVT